MSVVIDKMKDDLEAAKLRLQDTESSTHDAIQAGQRAQLKLDDAKREVAEYEDAIRALEERWQNEGPA